MLVTSNYVNYSRRNPKRSAQHAYHIGNHLLLMRAFLAERNSGQSKIRQIFDEPSFTRRVCYQEAQSSWPQIWEEARRQRILSG